MTTLKDAHACYSAMNFSIRLWGVSGEWQTEYDRLLKALGTAIMEEQGIEDPAIARALPEDTELGQRARTALQALRDFYDRTEFEGVPDSGALR